MCIRDRLETVVEESQRYPYFIQLWGEALWRRLRADKVSRVDGGLVAAARPDFDEQRKIYYEDRYDELDVSELIAAAKSVAVCFDGRNSAPRSALLDAVMRAGADEATADAQFTRLMELGYVWKQPSQREFEPGIPSLMSYVRYDGKPPGGGQRRAPD